MKKITYSILFVLLGVLLASTAYAASFTVNDLEFGSSDQKRGQDVTQILHIFNDGNDSLDLVLYSNMPSNYDVMFSPSMLTLGPGSSADVIVTIFIPDSQPSGRSEILGGVVVSSTNFAGLSKIARTYVTTMSMLEIKKLTIEVDGDESTLSRGENYDDLKAGSPIIIRVYVENNFDNSERIEIEDIEVDIDSSGDLDLDDSDEIGSLDYGDEESISFSAEIPDDADDGDDYDIEVTVEGRDENGIYHSDTYEATLEVSREAHEILITDLYFSPKTITCKGKVTLNIELENTGKYDEDNVQLKIVNTELDISEGLYQPELEKDDTLRKTFSFNIVDDVDPGSYEFMVTAFYDVDEVSDIQTAILEVEQCKTTTTTNTGTTTTTGTTTNTGTTTTIPSTNQPTIPQVIPITGATPAYGTASFADSPTYLIILVAAVIVLLLILIILLVKFVF
ncbi:MAG: hypothetical protein ACP5NW_02015 [Candidatus Woesearchaeota archaeon]